MSGYICACWAMAGIPRELWVLIVTDSCAKLALPNKRDPSRRGPYEDPGILMTRVADAVQSKLDHVHEKWKTPAALRCQVKYHQLMAYGGWGFYEMLVNLEWHLDTHDMKPDVLIIQSLGNQICYYSKHIEWEYALTYMPLVQRVFQRARYGKIFLGGCCKVFPGNEYCQAYRRNVDFIREVIHLDEEVHVPAAQCTVWAANMDLCPDGVHFIATDDNRRRFVDLLAVAVWEGARERGNRDGSISARIRAHAEQPTKGFLFSEKYPIVHRSWMDEKKEKDRIEKETGERPKSEGIRVRGGKKEMQKHESHLDQELKHPRRPANCVPMTDLCRKAWIWNVTEEKHRDPKWTPPAGEGRGRHFTAETDRSGGEGRGGGPMKARSRTPVPVHHGAQLSAKPSASWKRVDDVRWKRQEDVDNPWPKLHHPDEEFVAERYSFLAPKSDRLRYGQDMVRDQRIPEQKKTRLPPAPIAGPRAPTQRGRSSTPPPVAVHGVLLAPAVPVGADGWDSDADAPQLSARNLARIAPLAMTAPGQQTSTQRGHSADGLAHYRGNDTEHWRRFNYVLKRVITALRSGGDGEALRQMDAYGWIKVSSLAATKAMTQANITPEEIRLVVELVVDKCRFQYDCEHDRVRAAYGHYDRVLDQIPHLRTQYRPIVWDCDTYQLPWGLIYVLPSAVESVASTDSLRMDQVMRPVREVPTGSVDVMRVLTGIPDANGHLCETPVGAAHVVALRIFELVKNGFVLGHDRHGHFNLELPKEAFPGLPSKYMQFGKVMTLEEYKEQAKNDIGLYGARVENCMRIRPGLPVVRHDEQHYRPISYFRPDFKSGHFRQRPKELLAPLLTPAKSVPTSPGGSPRSSNQVNLRGRDHSASSKGSRDRPGVALRSNSSGAKARPPVPKFDKPKAVKLQPAKRQRDGSAELSDQLDSAGSVTEEHIAKKRKRKKKVHGPTSVRTGSSKPRPIGRMMTSDAAPVRVPDDISHRYSTTRLPEDLNEVCFMMSAETPATDTSVLDFTEGESVDTTTLNLKIHGQYSSLINEAKELFAPLCNPGDVDASVPRTISDAETMRDQFVRVARSPTHTIDRPGNYLLSINTDLLQSAKDFGSIAGAYADDQTVRIQRAIRLMVYFRKHVWDKRSDLTAQEVVLIRSTLYSDVHYKPSDSPAFDRARGAECGAASSVGKSPFAIALGVDIFASMCIDEAVVHCQASSTEYEVNWPAQSSSWACYIITYVLCRMRLSGPLKLAADFDEDTNLVKQWQDFSELEDIMKINPGLQNMHHDLTVDGRCSPVSSYLDDCECIESNPMFLWAKRRGPHFTVLQPTVNGESMKASIENMHVKQKGEMRPEGWSFIPPDLCEKQRMRPHPGCCSDCLRRCVNGKLVTLTRGKLAAGTYPGWMGDVFMSLTALLDVAMEGKCLPVTYFVGFTREGEDAQPSWGAHRLRVVNFHIVEDFLQTVASPLTTEHRLCPLLEVAMLGESLGKDGPLGPTAPRPSREAVPGPMSVESEDLKPWVDSALRSLGSPEGWDGKLDYLTDHCDRTSMFLPYEVRERTGRSIADVALEKEQKKSGGVHYFLDECGVLTFGHLSDVSLIADAQDRCEAMAHHHDGRDFLLWSGETALKELLRLSRIVRHGTEDVLKHVIRTELQEVDDGVKALNGVRHHFQKWMFQASADDTPREGGFWSYLLERYGCTDLQPINGQMKPFGTSVPTSELNTQAPGHLRGQAERLAETLKKREDVDMEAMGNGVFETLKVYQEVTTNRLRDRERKCPWCAVEVLDQFGFPALEARHLPGCRLSRSHHQCMICGQGARHLQECEAAKFAQFQFAATCGCLDGPGTAYVAEWHEARVNFTVGDGGVPVYSHPSDFKSTDGVNLVLPPHLDNLHTSFPSHPDVAAKGQDFLYRTCKRITELTAKLEIPPPDDPGNDDGDEDMDDDDSPPPGGGEDKGKDKKNDDEPAEDGAPDDEMGTPLDVMDCDVSGDAKMQSIAGKGATLPQSLEPLSSLKQGWVLSETGLLPPHYFGDEAHDGDPGYRADKFRCANEGCYFTAPGDSPGYLMKLEHERHCELGPIDHSFKVNEEEEVPWPARFTPFDRGLHFAADSDTDDVSKVVLVFQGNDYVVACPSWWNPKKKLSQNQVGKIMTHQRIKFDEHHHFLRDGVHTAYLSARVTDQRGRTAVDCADMSVEQAERLAREEHEGYMPIGPDDKREFRIMYGTYADAAFQVAGDPEDPWSHFMKDAASEHLSNVLKKAINENGEFEEAHRVLQEQIINVELEFQFKHTVFTDGLPHYLQTPHGDYWSVLSAKLRFDPSGVGSSHLDVAPEEEVPPVLPLHPPSCFLDTVLSNTINIIAKAVDRKKAGLEFDEEMSSRTKHVPLEEYAGTLSAKTTSGVSICDQGNGSTLVGTEPLKPQMVDAATNDDFGLVQKVERLYIALRYKHDEASMLREAMLEGEERYRLRARVMRDFVATVNMYYMRVDRCISRIKYHIKLYLERFVKTTALFSAVRIRLVERIRWAYKKVADQLRARQQAEDAMRELVRGGLNFDFEPTRLEPIQVTPANATTAWYDGFCADSQSLLSQHTLHLLLIQHFGAPAPDATKVKRCQYEQAGCYFCHEIDKVVQFHEKLCIYAHGPIPLEHQRETFVPRDQKLGIPVMFLQLNQELRAAGHKCYFLCSRNRLRYGFPDKSARDDAEFNSWFRTYLFTDDDTSGPLSPRGDTDLASEERLAMPPYFKEETTTPLGTPPGTPPSKSTKVIAPETPPEVTPSGSEDGGNHGSDPGAISLAPGEEP